MTKRLEAGKVGSSSQYITRAKALRRLQLSLADFRRLCILKGVYPRVPSTKKDGADKTYYHVRDIRCMAEDPLRDHIYTQDAAKKKHRKLVGRGAIAAARHLEASKSAVDMSHLLRERYPTFDAALLDLDDCLSTIAVMGSLQVNIDSKIDSGIVFEAQKLYNEFLAFVARTGRLGKVFASIKGFYLQATLPTGAKVTWLHPHQFTHDTPADVDLKVLSTFTEWYRTLLKFVNFKLYNDQGWEYPSGTNSSSFAELIAGLPHTGESSLFGGCVCVISREVPVIPILLPLISGGATVVPMGSNNVTHVVVDKPKGFIEEIKADREYVQPQWILDSFNEQLLLPTAEFGPGCTLPPHLSPFASPDAEYLPQRRQFLDSLKLQAQRRTHTDTVVSKECELDLLEGIDEELGMKRNSSRRVDSQVEVETRDQAVMLLSKKHRRLLQKIEGSKKTKRAAAEKLRLKAGSVEN